MRAQFITASEVAEIMGISRSKAYQIVREMNRELKSQGYLTRSPENAPPSISKQKFYGSRFPEVSAMTGNEKTTASSHLLAQMEGSRLTIQLNKGYHMKPAKAIPRRKILRKYVRESGA